MDFLYKFREREQIEATAAEEGKGIIFNLNMSFVAHVCLFLMRKLTGHCLGALLGHCQGTVRALYGALYQDCEFFLKGAFC